MFEKYALLDAQIKALTEEKDKLKEDIIRDMQLKNVDKMKHSMGSFTITHRKSWTYPAHLVEEEDRIKAEKAKAQDTGEATYTESESLTFTAAKL